MKKRYLLGSSVLGLAMCAAVAAEAAGPGEVVVEEETTTAAPAPAVTTETTVAETTKVEEEEKLVQRGFYVGGGVGGSFFDGPGRNSKIFNRETGDTNGDGQPDAFTVDEIDDMNNFMWSVFAGYRMADWLSAEVGWTDIGGFKATDLTDVGDALPHEDVVNVDVDGLEARLRGWVPLGTDRITGIGGLGIFIFSGHSPKKCKGTDQSACTNDPLPFDRNPPALDPREDSGQAFTLSAGLQIKITDNVHFRTEYSHFFNVLDQGVDMVTASVVVGFYDFFGQAGGGGESIGGIVVE